MEVLLSYPKSTGTSSNGKEMIMMKFFNRQLKLLRSAKPCTLDERSLLARILCRLIGCCQTENNKNKELGYEYRK